MTSRRNKSKARGMLTGGEDSAKTLRGLDERVPSRILKKSRKKCITTEGGE